MLSSTGRGRSRFPAQHRLGTPGLVHCREYPEIKLAPVRVHHRWLLGPVRHSWASLRRQVGSLRQVLSPG